MTSNKQEKAVHWLVTIVSLTILLIVIIMLVTFPINMKLNPINKIVNYILIPCGIAVIAMLISGYISSYYNYYVFIQWNNYYFDMDDDEPVTKHVYSITSDGPYSYKQTAQKRIEELYASNLEDIVCCHIKRIRDKDLQKTIDKLEFKFNKQLNDRSNKLA